MLIILFSCSPALAGPISFDRVDLISEDPGTWINYEAPLLAGYATKGLVRWLTQLKPVWKTSVPGLYFGISFISQSLSYESKIHPSSPINWTVSYQSQLLLPKGANLGLAWRKNSFRLAVGYSAVSESTWVRPAYRSWILLPTIGIGIGKQSQSCPYQSSI